jgi:hypothetical protein
VNYYSMFGSVMKNKLETLSSVWLCNGKWTGKYLINV